MINQVSRKIVGTTGIALAILFLLFLIKPFVATAAGEQLEDGDYNIPVSLWHATNNQASLGNNAIMQNGKLSKRGNETYLYIQFTSMFVGDMQGYLMELNLLEEGFVQNQNGYPAGYIIPSAVYATHSIIDEYNGSTSSDARCKNRQYPKIIGIPVHFGQEYTYAHVYVPIMGSMGFGDQICRIKLDFNATTLMTAEDELLWAGTTNIIQPPVVVEPPVPVNPPESENGNKEAGGEGNLDKDNLANGKYQVQVDIWHATSNQQSMGNPAVNKPSLLTVENGVYQIEISTKPMVVGSITACLQSLQIQQVNGEYLQAEITAKNNENNQPSIFRFTLPTKEEYTAIKIDPGVAIMGTEPLAARLKISWNTLKRVNDDTAPIENTQPAESDFSTEAVDIIDKKTGIRLRAEANILATGVKMTCKKLTSGTKYKQVFSQLSAVGTKMDIYEIILESPDGKVVQPAGMVTIHLPIRNEFVKDNIQTYRVVSNNKTLLSGNIEKQEYIFQTNTVETFGVVEKTNNPAANNSTKESNTVTKTSGTNAVKNVTPIPKADGANVGVNLAETDVRSGESAVFADSQNQDNGRIKTEQQYGKIIVLGSGVMSFVYVMMVVMTLLKRPKGTYNGILLLMIVFLVGSLSMNSYAAVGTAYIADVKRDYNHPVTGQSEDSGNNEEIGQPMVESVGYGQALIEKENTGNTYATIRMYMMDNISNVSFQTQERGASSWNNVSANIMQENMAGEYCSDYRLLIPSENAIVKVQAYVTPMGRAVVFFMSFSNLQEGNTDFIVSVAAETQGHNEQTDNDSAKEPTGQPVGDLAGNPAGQPVGNPAGQPVGHTAEVTENNQDMASGMVTGNHTLSARELIANAKGLLLSDESLLLTVGAVIETEENTEVEVLESQIQALPWVFVWQCILIMTVPALVTGSVLIAIRLIFNRKGSL